MQNFLFEIDENLNKKRLDKALSMLIEDLSRSKIKELILQGNVSVDGAIIIDPSYKLKLGSKAEIGYKIETENTLTPKNIPLDIIYEDEDIIIINKQPGLTVHPGAGNHNDTLVNALVHYCGHELSNIGGEARPGIVHRLDRDTSGLMVVAKNNFAHQKLSEAIANRDVKRKYKALIFKVLSPLIGKISTGYSKSKNDNTRMIATRGEEKLAITNYKTLKTFYSDAFSLVEFSLETGRTHQIRFHTEYLGTKIIGDKIYGRSLNFNLSEVPEGIRGKIKKVDRQLLHSYYLEFLHPKSGELMKFEIDCPKDFEKITGNIN